MSLKFETNVKFFLLLISGVGFWMLDAGCWILDAGCWILDAGCVGCVIRVFVSLFCYFAISPLHHGTTAPLRCKKNKISVKPGIVLIYFSYFCRGYKKRLTADS